jgi:aldehyde:ferredoxin oxidoreductase
MGAKNLKAVAVRGSNGLSVAHGSAFIDTVSGLINRLGHLPATGQSLPEFGSPYLLDSLAAMGGLAVRNHTAATAEMPSARELAAHYRLARSCFGCPIGCKQFGAVAQGPFASEGKGPEADAVAAFGPKCGVTDPAAIFKANRVCTLYGLDPVSAAGAIACAMELGAAGLMSGVPSFGDAAAMISALDEIGSGQGSLAALGDGAGELCRKAGRPDLFMGVNGAELAPFEPRALPALGLHMATSSLAPSELTAFGLISSAVNGHCPEAPEEAAAACARAQAESAIMDSLGLCALPLVAVPLSELLPMLGAATGWEIRLDEAMDMGAAVVELGRTLNTTAGAPEAALPHRLTDEPLASGPAKGKVCPLNDMLGAYLRRTGAAR